MKRRVCRAMAIAAESTVGHCRRADQRAGRGGLTRWSPQNILEIKNRLGVSILLIGHDMGLMAQLADRIAVMYAGNLVELASAKAVLKEPLHPYTQTFDRSRTEHQSAQAAQSDRRANLRLALSAAGLHFPGALPVRHGQVPPHPSPAPASQAASSGRLSFIRCHCLKSATLPRFTAEVSWNPVVSYALQDFSLTIPATPARIVTIAGESGSGKSTLASLVLGFTELFVGTNPLQRRRCDADDGHAKRANTGGTCKPSFKTRTRYTTRSTRYDTRSTW